MLPMSPRAVQDEALQQLLQTLKNPNIPDQQEQIFQILRGNPHLMAAFIRHRQQQARQMEQVQNPGAANPQQQQAVQGATLQQLLQTLRNPRTPEQQQQILQTLRNNPQLMALFIRQRQQQARQMQQVQNHGAANPQEPNCLVPFCLNINQRQGQQLCELCEQMADLDIGDL